MLEMTPPPFKDYLFNKFIEWEKEQPGRRSSFSAFARWLSENSFGIEIKQQLVSYWIKGSYKPSDDKYVLALAERLGNEIYDVLQTDRPDPFVTYVSRASSNLNDNQKRRIEEEIAKYVTANEKESRSPR